MQTEVSVLCIFYVFYYQIQKMGSVSGFCAVQWKCYCILKSSSAVKYSEVSTSYARQCDRIILDFIRIQVSWGCVGEVNDQRRWGFGSGGLGQLLEGQPQPGPTLSQGSCFHSRFCCRAWPELQSLCIAAVRVPGCGLLVQTTQSCSLPGLGTQHGAFASKGGHCLSCDHAWIPASLANPSQ